MTYTEEIDTYITGLDGDRKDWVGEIAAFLRENFADAREDIRDGAPTWWLGEWYISVSAGDKRLRFCTNDAETLELLAMVIQNTSVRAGGILVPYTQHSDLWTLLDAIRDIARKVHGQK